MSQALAWGKDPTSEEWIPIQVDEDGKLVITAG